MNVVTRMGIVVVLATSLVSAEEIDRNNWIDWSLPRSVSVSPFGGERYEAEVPDTPDLVDHANCALNMATRLWVPEWGYELFNSVDMSTNPPNFSMGSGGLVTESAKITEAIPMLRVMTGSTYNIDMDNKAIMSFVRVTGKSGLCYYPVENRPWAFFDEYTKTLRQPYSDIFAEGRQLLAYASWYQHDKNPLWKELAQRKVHRLLEMVLKKNDTFYFRLGRGYTPWDDPKEGPIVAIGDSDVYDANKGMVGTPASYIVGFFPQAGAIWYQLTKEDPFLELSRGLAIYLHRYGQMLDPNTGKILADHNTHVSHSLLANLSWALAFDDQGMVQWVKKGYEYLVNMLDPYQTGVLLGREACLEGDTVGIGIMLTQAGAGDYWETVDRIIRNSYLDTQITNVDWIKNMRLTRMEKLDPGQYQYDDGAQRCLGVWRDNLDRWDWAQGCCNGNCSRMLYYVWKNILTDKDNTLRVNLLYNRASPWADIDSWLPYEGRVQITMKVAREHVLVRVPEWTDKEQLNCTINSKKVSVAWSANYVDIHAVNQGDHIVIEFPIKQRTIKASLPVIVREKGKDEYWITKETTVTLKGNTVIGIEPTLGYPLFQHEKYRAGKAPMKKVVRFVSKEQFLF
jgi:hypothetical protein